eukprot:7343659-Prymnesium_polylepis.1
MQGAESAHQESDRRRLVEVFARHVLLRDVQEQLGSTGEGEERDANQHWTKAQVRAQQGKDREHKDRDRIVGRTPRARGHRRHAHANEELHSHRVIGVKRTHGECTPQPERERHAAGHPKREGGARAAICLVGLTFALVMPRPRLQICERAPLEDVEHDAGSGRDGVRQQDNHLRLL